ncbi:MAG: hypothetical protein JNM94_08520 [Phycisphaerae bacterium]|nr:hypothetical protein [Phycisphaerae bacterium]
MTESPDHIPTSPNPDFDGHIERPFETWTATERLRWLDEMLWLQWVARKAEEKPRAEGVQ